MNFGVDIDGTITAAPGPYREMMKAMVAAGHEVHVITGQSTPITPENRPSRVHQLGSLGIASDCYTHLHIAGPPDWVVDKATYCRDKKIAFMFENDSTYARAIGQVCPVTVMWV